MSTKISGQANQRWALRSLDRPIRSERVAIQVWLRYEITLHVRTVIHHSVLQKPSVRLTLKTWDPFTCTKRRDKTTNSRLYTNGGQTVESGMLVGHYQRWLPATEKTHTRNLALVINPVEEEEPCVSHKPCRGGLLSFFLWLFLIISMLTGSFQWLKCMAQETASTGIGLAQTSATSEPNLFQRQLL